MKFVEEPPTSDDIRDMVANRLRQAESSAGARETVTVEWRDQPLHIDVISMPVNWLYYNPETHRIKAQRDHDVVKDQQLTEDPWSTGSQEYLHYLLKANPADPDREDPDFLALMEDLQKYDQKEPGIITPNGILVNGNTRRAALKELGRENIRVGVLPADWAWNDIGAVELELQLRKEHRRDYSYINQLIAIEDEDSRGLSDAEVCKKFRIQERTYKQSRWILQFIREAIRRSRVELSDGSMTSMRLVDFEQHQEKLKELQRRYAELDLKDRDAADQLKENRLLAIVLNKSKTDVRWIDPDFRRKYLEDKLTPELRPQSRLVSGNGVTIPGLSPGTVVPSSSAAVKSAQATTDVVLKAIATRSAARRATPTQLSAASTVMQAANEAVNRGIRAAGRDGMLRKRKAAAPEKLTDANDLLRGLVDEIASARSKGVLDEEALDDALRGLRNTLADISRQASRGVREPGEGLRWLQHATEDVR